MNTKAAVTTPKGLGAISNIQLAGGDAAKMIETITRPAPNNLNVGQIHVCEIIDGDDCIDHVVIGHETENSFAISCHGNPFITEAIIKLLQKHGTEIVSPETLLLDLSKTQNTIQAEAKLAQLKASSIEAVKLIAAQCTHGLTKTVANWHDNKELLLQTLVDQCNQILEVSRKARPLIYGCTVVIAGAPNSGKSTLINAIAGKQKAIVTDIAGTTRDWVSIDCRIGPVLVKFIDTAGLDENLTNNAIDMASQKTAQVMIGNADLIVYLSDAQNQQRFSPPDWIDGKTVIYVQNKCDLLGDPQKNDLPRDNIAISAANSTGLENLYDAISDRLGVTDLDPETPVCFTQRQFDLLSTISNTEDFSLAKAAITQLLNGPVSV